VQARAPISTLVTASHLSPTWLEGGSGASRISGNMSQRGGNDARTHTRARTQTHTREGGKEGPSTLAILFTEDPTALQYWSEL